MGKQSYLMTPYVITWDDFVFKLVNKPNKSSVIGSFQVPMGTRYMFYRCRHSTDLDAPYLYGEIRTKYNKLIKKGDITINIKDVLEAEVIGTPFIGHIHTFNIASPIDWNLRLFFNTEKLIIAPPASTISVIIKSPKIISLKSFQLNMMVYKQLKIGEKFIPIDRMLMYTC